MVLLDAEEEEVEWWGWWLLVFYGVGRVVLILQFFFEGGVWDFGVVLIFHIFLLVEGMFF